MFKHFKFIFLLIFLPFFCSCSKTRSALAKENVESLSITGELLHTQYWNKNDNWDLDGLFVFVYYSDGTSNNYSFSSESIIYACLPSKPVSGLEELTVADVYYVDRLNNHHLVCDKITYPISIVDYPYEYAKVNLNDFIAPTIIISIIVVILSCGTIMYHVSKKGPKWTIVLIFSKAGMLFYH